MIDRRTLLRTTGVATLGGAVATMSVGHAAAEAAPVFGHGVASGDPLPDQVIIWTRVTPTSDAAPGSGRGSRVTVRWEVGRDPSLRRPVASGTRRTGPDRDHTVKVDVAGLAPCTTYYYRFRLGSVTSQVGRLRTAPRPGHDVTSLRFGAVSCANWEAGYFAPYRYLADRGDLDAVLHLGDYLYEYPPGEYGAGERTVRSHRPAVEIVELAQYRARHAQYKSDPDLQALHAVAPFVVTLDDHEISNDAYADGAENHQPATEGGWRARRTAALRAYREWMPIRTDTDRIYRRLRFGDLAELSLLDLRSYRSRQVGTGDPGADDNDRTIAGTEQLDWLIDGLTASEAQWKLVGNPVMIAPVLVPPLPTSLTGPVTEFLNLIPRDGYAYNPDQWDGYTADRRRLVEALYTAGVRDAVFLTGDIHSSWACDLPLDAGLYPLSPSVAAELVTTSVTSDNLDDMIGSAPRTASITVEQAIQTANRHVRFLEFDSHGASVLDVTPQRVQLDWHYVADRTRRDASMRPGPSWQVRAGTQRVSPAPQPIPTGGRP